MDYPTSLYQQIYYEQQQQGGGYATPTQLMNENYDYIKPPTLNPTPEVSKVAQNDNCCTCIETKLPISSNTHLNAHDIKPSLLPISRIFFSSCACYKNRLYDPSIWKHIRSNQPDLWIWLGDNVYSDGVDMNYKRKQYNSARDDKYYNTFGFIGEPRIPVTGIWDDHDFGSNDIGSEYRCSELSQREFCIHFNISKNDKRHWEYEPKQDRRNGIYSSLVLPPPPPFDVYADNIAGVHIINLDTRSQRSRLKKRAKGCDKNNIFLNEEQWDWLQNELLEIPSEIKIITTSVQALTPTDTNNMKSLCAYDGEDRTFMKAIRDLGEEDMHFWMKNNEKRKELYLEKWADIPNERYKLLTLAQLSLNRNKTKQIIFLSGNAHFGDFLAKRMPASPTHGRSQILYEVVASGVGQTPRIKYYPNTLRIRLRSCDTNGDGYYFNECKFPFNYNNQIYYDCASININDRDPNKSWCLYKVDDTSAWGYCIPEEKELVPRSDQIIPSTSGKNITCSSQNYHHVCGMANMYGGISIDWENGIIHLTNYSPQYTESLSTVAIHFEPEWKKQGGNSATPPKSSSSKFKLSLHSFLSSSPTVTNPNTTKP